MATKKKCKELLLPDCTGNTSEIEDKITKAKLIYGGDRPIETNLEYERTVREGLPEISNAIAPRIEAGLVPTFRSQEQIARWGTSQIPSAWKELYDAYVALQTNIAERYHALALDALLEGSVSHPLFKYIKTRPDIIISFANAYPILIWSIFYSLKSIRRSVTALWEFIFLSRRWDIIPGEKIDKVSQNQLYNKLDSLEAAEKLLELASDTNSIIESANYLLKRKWFKYNINEWLILVLTENNVENIKKMYNYMSNYFIYSLSNKEIVKSFIILYNKHPDVPPPKELLLVAIVDNKLFNTYKKEYIKAGLSLEGRNSYNSIPNDYKNLSDYYNNLSSLIKQRLVKGEDKFIRLFNSYFITSQYYLEFKNLIKVVIDVISSEKDINIYIKSILDEMKLDDEQLQMGEVPSLSFVEYLLLSELKSRSYNISDFNIEYDLLISDFRSEKIAFLKDFILLDDNYNYFKKYILEKKEDSSRGKLIDKFIDLVEEGEFKFSDAEKNNFLVDVIRNLYYKYANIIIKRGFYNPKSIVINNSEVARVLLGKLDFRKARDKSDLKKLKEKFEL